MASNGTRFLGNRPINVKKVRKKSETHEELSNKEELVRKISENEDDLFPSCIFDDSNKSGNSGYLSSTPTKTHETSQSRLANPNNSTLSDEEKRLLSSWGLPDTVQRQYASNGIISMFQWQVECLSIGEVLEVQTVIKIFWKRLHIINSRFHTYVKSVDF